MGRETGPGCLSLKHPWEGDGAEEEETWKARARGGSLGHPRLISGCYGNLDVTKEIWLMCVCSKQNVSQLVCEQTHDAVIKYSGSDKRQMLTLPTCPVSPAFTHKSISRS